jgi:hypothetical protein
MKTQLLKWGPDDDDQDDDFDPNDIDWDALGF